MPTTSPTKRKKAVSVGYRTGYATSGGPRSFSKTSQKPDTTLLNIHQKLLLARLQVQNAIDTKKEYPNFVREHMVDARETLTELLSDMHKFEMDFLRLYKEEAKNVS